MVHVKKDLGKGCLLDGPGNLLNVSKILYLYDQYDIHHGKSSTVPWILMKSTSDRGPTEEGGGGGSYSKVPGLVLTCC